MVLEGVEPISLAAQAHRAFYTSRSQTKWDEPETLFLFKPGDRVLVRKKVIGKLEARQVGPFTVQDVSGKYGQRVQMFKDGAKKFLTYHASLLTPYIEE